MVHHAGHDIRKGWWSYFLKVYFKCFERDRLQDRTFSKKACKRSGTSHSKLSPFNPMPSGFVHIETLEFVPGCKPVRIMIHSLWGFGHFGFVWSWGTLLQKQMSVPKNVIQGRLWDCPKVCSKILPKSSGPQRTEWIKPIRVVSRCLAHLTIPEL